MPKDVISKHCFVLCELAMIEAEVILDKKDDVYYPVRITSDGMNLLSESSRSFWEYAEKSASDAFEHVTGFDPSSAIKFFISTINKYREERRLK